MLGCQIPHESLVAVPAPARSRHLTVLWGKAEGFRRRCSLDNVGGIEHSLFGPLQYHCCLLPGWSTSVHCGHEFHCRYHAGKCNREMRCVGPTMTSSSAQQTLPAYSR